MVATDHAPHSAEEKARGLEGSPFGIVGLETAFPVLYTGLVQTGVLSLEKLLKLLIDNPRSRFSLPAGCDFSVWDLHEAYAVEPSSFRSMGRVTPFEGKTVQGRCLATFYHGKQVYTYKG